MHRKTAVTILAGVLAIGFCMVVGAAAGAAGRTGEPDDGIMGEYVGKYRAEGGSPTEAVAKVIGEGDGNYRAVLTAGKGVRIELRGKAQGKRVTFEGKAGDVEWRGKMEGGEVLIAESKAGEFSLKYVQRKSPTEGAEPPAGAVVLLPFKEGKPTSLNAWSSMDGKPAPWKILDDGSILVEGGNIQTRKALGNTRLHVEFLCPYMPKDRGQGRGNSGVYLQSRYEVQVLDSFGLEPRDNECGGIYSVGAPKTIASLPPGRWQTYDITFVSPEVEGGKITKPAVLTVRHNGVLIHDSVKADHVTTAGVGGPVVSPAPLMLQDHGNAVRYRNIWYVEMKD